MTDRKQTHDRLNWLVDKLVAGVPETHHAIVLSEDGVLLAQSKDLPGGDAEHLSAVASGLYSLADGAAHCFEQGQVRQTVIEMEKLFLLVADAGEGARLALLASGEVDVGLAAYEMTRVVVQVGDYLSASPRTKLPHPAADQSP
jgi:predicted regulator of Ras-like GTPase activity (Roadblock/LC7/MglB family)